MSRQPVPCIACSHPLQGPPRSTFLGFQKYDCPHCRRPVVHELRMPYRLLYMLLLSVMLGVSAWFAQRSEIPIPGLLGLAVVWALVADTRKRSQLRAAREQAAASLVGHRSTT